jgi:hypothetical protein
MALNRATSRTTNEDVAMTNLFRNSSPGALTLQQSIALAKKRVAERRRQMRQAQELAAQGRGDDTEVAHVARGEYVIPEALQTPEVLAALQRAAADCGVPLERLNVGHAMNSINPNTGAPEFGFSDWFSGLFGGNKNHSAPQLPSDMPVPPDASVSQNIKDAENRLNPMWFYDQVRNRKDQPDYKWDYKQKNPAYEPFGNFNYGATGAAFGFPDWVLKRAAGFAQGQSGNKDSGGQWWGAAPYGDDEKDQIMIQKGIDYYRNGGR